jgi:hypothetical protein
MADVVVQLDPPVLRVMEARGKLSFEVPVDPGALRAGAVEDQAALRDALRSAVQQLVLRGKKPRRLWWVLPLEAAAEHVFTLPPVARRDLRPAVERVVGEWLGPDAPPVSVKWRVVARGDDLRVYVSAVRSDTLASLRSLADSLGLKVRGYLGLTPVLCQAVNEGCLLYAAPGGQVLAAWVRGRQPVWLLREEIFPGDDPVAVLAGAVEMCRGDGWRVERVFLAGAADNEEVAAALESRGLGVVPLPGWPGEALARAFRAGIDHGQGDGGKTLRKRLALAMVLVLALEVCGMVAGWSRAQARLEAVQLEVQARARQVTEVQQVAKQVTSLKAQVEEVKKLLEPPEPRPDWEALYGTLVRAGGEVSVEKIDASREKEGGWVLQVRGRATSVKAAVDYARSLRTGAFSRPCLEKVSVGQEGSVQFEVRVRWSP